ncbi:MAG TPA: RNA 3'-terminal phosphate cyclase, partial [Candidatus Acidoferrum sp.]|nr:RNA 3'-terminal phosphate cyclase [Candidatus Acidoferrum sp.]
SIVLWAETDTGTVLGADAIGELRKTSETVGKEAAEKLVSEISAKPTVDIHLADMLIPYVALAHGTSTFLTRTISDHLESNIWLVEEMLDARFTVERADGLFKVTRVG